VLKRFPHKLMVGFINEGFFVNLISLYFIQIFNYVFPVLIIPILISYVGINSFGKYVLVQAILSQLITVCDWSFWWSATRAISLSKGDRKRCSEIVSVHFSVQVKLIAVCTFVLILLGVCVNFQFEFMAFVFIGLFAHVLSLQWFFQGIERMNVYAIIQFLQKSLFLLGLLLLPKSGAVLHQILLLQACTLIIPAMYLFYHARSIYPFKVNLIEGWFTELTLLKENFRLFIARFTWGFQTTAPIYILGFLGHESLAASFSIADKIRLAAQSLLNPLIQALVVRLGIVFSLDEATAMDFFWRILAVGCSVSVALSLIVFSTADFLVGIVAGTEIADATSFLQLSSCALVFLTVSNLIGGHYFIARGLYRHFSEVIFVGASLSVFLTISLVVLGEPRMFILGVLIGDFLVASLLFAALLRHQFFFKI
jgi:O-antigen/teichoic acid export membrane protein